MIGADQRSVLTEALTPPVGYTFDSGLATTYTLDLVTLLGLPLHLAVIAGSADEEDGGFDPLATLEALRRTASRLTVFCDRGRMAAPRAASTLLGLLEPMVHEVESPHGGSFHPKVWLLRFVGSEKADVRLTLLVLSRNITADDSWDLSLRMDGTPGLRRQSRNEPLCRLFEACIERAGLNRPLEAKRLADAKTLLRDAARCEWTFPGEFEDVVFHAIGIDRRPSPWLPRLQATPGPRSAWFPPSSRHLHFSNSPRRRSRRTMSFPARRSWLSVDLARSPHLRATRSWRTRR